MSDVESSIAFESENVSAQRRREEEQASAEMYPVEDPVPAAASDAPVAESPVFHIEPQGNQVSPPQWALNQNNSMSFKVESPGVQSLEFVSAPRSVQVNGSVSGRVHESIDFHVEPTTQPLKSNPRSKNDSVVFQMTSEATSAPASANTHDIQMVDSPASSKPTEGSDSELSSNDVVQTAMQETEEVASEPTPQTTSSSELSTPRDHEVPTAAAPVQDAEGAAATSRGTSSLQFESMQPSSAEEAALQPATTTAPRAGQAVEVDNGAAVPAPPAHLSRRAEAIARERATTPRSAALPKTPRTRSAGSTWVPRPQSPTSTSSDDQGSSATSSSATSPSSEEESASSSEETAPVTQKPTAVARPPLAPSSGAPAAPMPAAQPVRYARAPSAGSDFSAFDSGSNSEMGSLARSERGQAPPDAAPIQAVAVTDHTVHVEGEQWGSLVKASSDAVERALISDVAEAAGVETAFINVMGVAADEAGQPGLSAQVKVAHDANQSFEEVDAKLAKGAFTQTRLLYGLSTGEQAPAPAAATRAIAPIPSVDSDADSSAVESPVHTDGDDDGPVFVEEPADQVPEALAPATAEEPAAKPPKKKTKRAKSKSKSKPRSSTTKTRKSPKRAKSPATPAKTARGKTAKNKAAPATTPRRAQKPSATTAPTYSPYQERELPWELTTRRTYTPRTPRPGADSTPRLSSRPYRGSTDGGSTSRRSASVGTRSIHESTVQTFTSRRSLSTVAGAHVPPQTVQRAVRPITPRASYRSQARPVMDATAATGANTRARLAPPSPRATAPSSSSQLVPHPSTQRRDHSPEQIREDQAAATEIRARQLLQQLRQHNASVQPSQARTTTDSIAPPPTHATEGPRDLNSPPRGLETHSVSRRSHSRHQSPTRAGGRAVSPNGASPLPRASGYPVEVTVGGA